MSIFKESFKKYVRKQLAIRQAIVAQGNKGDARTTGTTTVAEGDSVTIDAGAFYTNTVNRSCVIRMSSGVDLKPGSEGLLEGGKFEKESDLVGTGLARRYILEGGTLINIKNSKGYNNFSESEYKVDKKKVFDIKHRAISVDNVSKDDLKLINKIYKKHLNIQSILSGK